MRTTRAKHLAWCKARAFEILERGISTTDAYASFLSDMNKHPETADHIALPCGVALLAMGENQDAASMRKWIEGFN